MRILFHFVDSLLDNREGKSEGFTGTVMGRGKGRRGKGRERGGKKKEEKEEKEEKKNNKPCKR